MATNAIPLPKLGSIQIRVDRIYGKLTVYPVCERAKLIAQIAGTTTLTHQALCLAERLGFEITFSGESMALDWLSLRKVLTGQVSA